RRPADPARPVDAVQRRAHVRRLARSDAAHGVPGPADADLPALPRGADHARRRSGRRALDTRVGHGAGGGEHRRLAPGGGAVNRVLVCLSDYPRDLLEGWVEGTGTEVVTVPAGADLAAMLPDLARADLVIGDAARRFP